MAAMERDALRPLSGRQQSSVAERRIKTRSSRVRDREGAGPE
jgi:hypothetical protein